MATVRKRGSSYQIRVSSGYDSQYRQVVRTKTWKPTPGMTPRQAEKRPSPDGFQWRFLAVFYCLFCGAFVGLVP